jgi:hypothetical protein
LKIGAYMAYELLADAAKTLSPYLQEGINSLEQIKNLVYIALGAGGLLGAGWLAANLIFFGGPRDPYPDK